MSTLYSTRTMMTTTMPEQPYISLGRIKENETKLSGMERVLEEKQRALAQLAVEVSFNAGDIKGPKLAFI